MYCIAVNAVTAMNANCGAMLDPLPALLPAVVAEAEAVTVVGLGVGAAVVVAVPVASVDSFDNQCKKEAKESIC
jgi:hypothetical protein